MASLGENLKAIRQARKLTQKQLGIKSGVKQSTISELETGETGKTGFIVELARGLGVTSELLTSSEPVEHILDKLNAASKLRIVEDDSDKVSNIIHHSASPIIVNKQEFSREYIWLDVMNASFSCGEGISIEYHFDEVRDSIPFPPEFFIRKQVKPENTKLLVASGDSMEDYIYDQDLFAIDVTSTEILDGQIYAVYFEGEGMLKQIFKEEGGNLVLHSLNPKYRDRRVTELNGTNFKVMGRQYWRAG